MLHFFAVAFYPFDNEQTTHLHIAQDVRH